MHHRSWGSRNAQRRRPPPPALLRTSGPMTLLPPHEDRAAWTADKLPLAARTALWCRARPALPEEKPSSSQAPQLPGAFTQRPPPPPPGGARPVPAAPRAQPPWLPPCWESRGAASPAPARPRSRRRQGRLQAAAQGRAGQGSARDAGAPHAATAFMRGLSRAGAAGLASRGRPAAKPCCVQVGGDASSFSSSDWRGSGAAPSPHPPSHLPEAEALPVSGSRAPSWTA